MSVNRVAINRVVYHEPMSIVPWTTVYGDELLNFLSIVDTVYASKIPDWRTGKARVIHRNKLEEILSRFPLKYIIEYDPSEVYD